MVGTHRILAVISEPGDESWAFGAVLARYADEGTHVHLVCATLGEMGRFGASTRAFPPGVLGRMRERELMAAAQVIGIRQTEVMGYGDGAVASVDPFRLQMDLAERIRRIRPQVVLTFGSQGPEGDPDRIAVTEATHAAILAAARHSAPVPGGHAPHAVRKVYRRAWSVGRPRMPPATATAAGLPEGPASPPLPPSTPEWMITTVVNTEEHRHRGREALARHRSRSFGSVADCNADTRLLEANWRHAEFVRSLATVVVPGGRETDLLTGIRRGESRNAIRAA